MAWEAEFEEPSKLDVSVSLFPGLFLCTTTMITKADELEMTVLREMYHAAFGNTPGFFDTLFTCDDMLIDQIYEHLTSGEKPLYSEADECWTSLPTNPTSEHALYEPLVETFNAITEACSVIMEANGKAMTFNLGWQDVHSKKFESDAAVGLCLTS